MMKKNLLVPLTACLLMLATGVQAQFRVAGINYTTLEGTTGALAAVPATGVETVVEVTADAPIAATAVVAANQHVRLRSNGGAFILKRQTPHIGYLIEVMGTGALTMENVTIDGGAVWSDQALTAHADTTRTNSGLTAERAIVRVASGGSLTIESGAVLQNNHNSVGAHSHSAAGVRNEGRLTMNGTAAILRCTYSGMATGASAGAVYSSGGGATVVMNGNSVIAGCQIATSDNNAGGIFSAQGSTVTMNDHSAVYGCRSISGGGGITQRAFQLTMNNHASVYECHTRISGGGVLVYTAGTIVMNDHATVRNNQSRQTGGGIGLSSNTGGGNSSILRMNDDASVTGNTAVTSGGGLFNLRGWAYLNDRASIDSNHSENFGGGISVQQGGEIYLNDNSAVRLNKADNQSGGIYAAGSPTARTRLYLAGGTIHENTSVGSGGGLYQASDVTTFLTGTTISNNTSNTNGGGGIFATGMRDTIYMSGGRISGNNGPSAGGVALLNQATMIMTGGEISGNTAARRGGGILINGHTTNVQTLTVVGAAVIKNNSAQQGDDVLLSADKAGGPPSVFNLDGTATIEGEIYLEKDTLNPVPGGSALRNKAVTLVGVPTRNYRLATNRRGDSPYGRIVVVPGTVTVGTTTYTLADASPYASSFRHNVKPVVEGLAGTATMQRLMLGCFNDSTLLIHREPAGRSIRLDVPQTFSVPDADPSARYEWTFGGTSPATSTSATPTVTWRHAGAHGLTLKLYETGISYAPGDTMRCHATINTTVRVRDRGVGLFVDHRATAGRQTGDSWANAFLTLDTALLLADKGDFIWVAQGVYTPGAAGSFVMDYDSVSVYGGFAGTETNLSERRPADHPTELVGRDSSVIRIDGNRTYAEGPCGISRGARWDGFIISGGRARYGAGIYNDNGSPTIANCIIRHNTATVAGGGIYTVARGSCTNGAPHIVNTEISDNRAPDGAGFYSAGGNWAMLNVTVAGNRSSAGGAVSIHGGAPELVNTIVWGNETTDITVADGASPLFAYSLVRGWTPALGRDGTHNLTSSPLFRRPAIHTGSSTVRRGDYRLLHGSAAINAGNTRAAALGFITITDALLQRPKPVETEGLPFDLAGNVRIYDDIVDIGAYEYTPDGDGHLQYLVHLHEAVGLTYSLEPGEHPVRGHDNFVFTVAAAPGYTIDNLIVSTGVPRRDREGVVVRKNSNGSYTVVVLQVYERLDIRLNGATPTGTDAVEISSMARGEGKQLVIDTPQAALVAVYDMRGRQVLMRRVDAGQTAIALPAGIYVAVIDGKACRVAVGR